MKKFVTLCAATTVALTLATAPVWADAAKTTAQPTGDSSNTTVVQPLRGARAGAAKQNKDQQLQQAYTQLQKYQSLVQTAIQKAEAKRDTQLQNLDTKEGKMQAALNDAEKRDAEEKKLLDNEIAKWTDYEQKVTAGVNDRLSQIDSNLQKSLADLDTKIAAATDAATKQSLTAQETTLKSQADAKKAALQNYLTTLQGIWTDRQKVWSERKDLLTRRQIADSDLRKALQGVQQTNIDNKTTQVNKTDDQIASEVQARYQKAIDAVKARIQRLGGQVPTDSTTATPVQSATDQATSAPTTTPEASGDKVTVDTTTGSTTTTSTTTDNSSATSGTQTQQ